jgi:CRISPR/Cas system-associated protein Cas10 (large subunit of type III CRISPR-Cas system)
MRRRRKYREEYDGENICTQCGRHWDKTDGYDSIRYGGLCPSCEENNGAHSSDSWDDESGILLEGWKRGRYC